MLDRARADAFWARYRATLAPGQRVPEDGPGFECFGDSVEMADELIELVVNGPKRATAGALADYEADDEPIPEVGDCWIAADGRGIPRAVIQTTDVRIGPLSSVDESFAWDEGEGDRTRDDWLRGHTRFFRRRYEVLGRSFGPDIPVVFERFEVPYQE